MNNGEHKGALRPGAQGALVLAVMGAGFMISQFLRNSTGALVPFLAEEFALGSEDLGFLAGSLFASFALATIPVGVLLDRYGPRIVMTLLMLVAGLGCLVFALADQIAGLVAGRLLMGVGCAALLMGPLTVISRWYAPAMFSTLTALIMATGNLGSLLSTEPLAFAAGLWGWRMVFVAAGLVALAISLSYWLNVRDAPVGHAFHDRERESWRKGFGGVGEALKVAGLWPVFVMHFVFYAVIAALIGVWGPVYLATVFELGSGQIGRMLFFIVAGIIAGMLVLGPCDRVFGTRKWIVLVSALGMVAGFVALAVVEDLSLFAAMCVMVLIGFFGGASTVLLAHGRGLFESRLVGRGLTVVNTAVMAGVFVVQSGSGYLADFGYPTARTINDLPIGALQLVFWFLAVVLACGCLIYLLSPDPMPEREL